MCQVNRAPSQPSVGSTNAAAGVECLRCHGCSTVQAQRLVPSLRLGFPGVSREAGRSAAKEAAVVHSPGSAVLFWSPDFWALCLLKGGQRIPQTFVSPTPNQEQIPPATKQQDDTHKKSVLARDFVFMARIL